MDIDYSRQTGLFNPYTEKDRVTIIGCGGIGSFTAYTLAKMGIRELILYDPDIVEEPNIPNQLFEKEDIGKKKVKAIEEKIRRLGYEEVITISKKFSEQAKICSEVVVVAVDTLEKRKEIWQVIKAKHSLVQTLIDGRMGGLTGKVLTVQLVGSGLDDWYETTLEGKPLSLPCSERAIIFMNFIIAGVIASVVRRTILGERVPRCLIIDGATGTIFFQDYPFVMCKPNLSKVDLI